VRRAGEVSFGSVTTVAFSHKLPFAVKLGGIQRAVEDFTRRFVSALTMMRLDDRARLRKGQRETRCMPIATSGARYRQSCQIAGTELLLIAKEVEHVQGRSHGAG
jgi:hypothetical protein